MTANQVKILVSVFIALALWRLFELPGVATAFWAFCTVGALPGTGVVLGYETMARSLIAVFVVVLLIVFRKELMAALHRGGKSRLHRSAHQAVAGALAVTETVYTAPVTPASAGKTIVIHLSKQIDRPVFTQVRPLLVILLVAASWLVRLVAAIERHVHQGLLFASRWVVRGSVIAYRAGRKATNFAVRLVVTLWKLCEPHFRTFDHYLEETLHANKYTGEALKFMGDANKTVADAYRKAHEATRKTIHQ